MSRVEYLVRREKDGGETKTILVETSSVSDTPRRAAAVGEVGRAAKELQQEFELITAIAESLLVSLKSVKPGKVGIEFGVELGGEVGIPLITSGTAKANFKVTLGWEEKSSAS